MAKKKMLFEGLAMLKAFGTPAFLCLFLQLIITGLKLHEQLD